MLEITAIANTLEHAGFSAYLVGGCVRDLLLGREPDDWDLATDATPEEIQSLFPECVYENDFGTVGIKTDSEDPRLTIVEVTTFRKEGTYTDKRHPDEITFSKTIEEDLARRDFTINAIALNISAAMRMNAADANTLIDPFRGMEDLGNGIIRAVGNPADRFREDALRVLRAIRLAATLGFTIDPATLAAIGEEAGGIDFVAKERIRDEFFKLIMTDHAAEGVQLLERTGLLLRIFPELQAGVGVSQNKHHIYTVFEHNLRSLQYAVEQKFSLDIRLSALFHDVGKPHTKHGEGENCTFYGHQVVGERMVLKIGDRLHFSKEITEKIALLVREHMFVYDPDSVTLKGVRRLLQRVGVENVEDLFRLREADRIGSGVPKAQPYRLRYLKAMVDKVKSDPISAKMLKVNGEDIMRELEIQPGPRIGALLAILLEDVLENPTLNTKEHLLKRARELAGIPEAELLMCAHKARDTAHDAQERIDQELLKKHFVSK
ncbi:MAG: CCA tRNA nucleotidyltransferase [Patescibacteria group bacterium]|nr:CCA tRNA nucleotidyltransferase [Patescibacteria group bacterium]MDE2438380.1 CCA tRNA nucleotidyltransferase [Patescibacteria group bacterium]